MKAKVRIIDHRHSLLRCILISLVLCVILLGCKQESIHFSTDVYGRILIPVVIEGEKINFMFDTGSNYSALDDKYKDVIAKKCSVIGKREGENITQIVQVEQYSAATLSIGSFKFKNRLFLDTNDILGNVLSMDIISQNYWCFDFEEEVARISKYPIPVSGDKELEWSYFMSDGCMFVTLPMNEQDSLKLLFDTGAGGHYQDRKDIYYPDILLYMNNDALFANSDSESSHTLFFKNDSLSGHSLIMDTLPIDKYTLRYPLIRFYYGSNDKRLTKNYDGTITMDFVRRFSKFCIDPVHKKLIFYNSNRTKEEKVKMLKNRFDSIYKEQQKVQSPGKDTVVF